MRKTTAAAMLLLASVLLADCATDNVQTTRTSIKVARNLDPDAMETLEVKTRTGDVATIVVKKRDGRQRSAEPDMPRPVTSRANNDRAAAVPDPVVVRSDSVYVKDQKDGEKRTRSLFSVDSDGIPVITGVREPDDENDTQVWRNARVINGVLVPNANKPAVGQKEADKPAAVTVAPAPMFNGVWQVYKRKPEPVAEPAADGQRYSWSLADRQDEKYMTDKILGYIRDINGNVLQDHNGKRSARTLQMEPARMEARVLHAPGVSVFPDSAAYSSPKTASRLSFEESARTPVLQYAHPELGVQAAKYVPPEEPAAVQRDGRRQQALSYFGHDIHADRSPFAFEPGLEKESRVKVPPKKYTPQYAFPEKHGKYVPANYYVGDEDEASFWTMMKNKMRTSLDKVSDYTRPVVDPLVEATHKITGNLGFGHGNRELTNVVKEKLGMVATPSVLLPALGLVAGGAALGLGAVAVGRYLDYDVVRMRNNDDIEFQRTLNGSYQPIIIQPEQLENQKTDSEKQVEPLKRSKRSLHHNRGRNYRNRKIKKVRLTLKTL